MRTLIFLRLLNLSVFHHHICNLQRTNASRHNNLFVWFLVSNYCRKLVLWVFTKTWFIYISQTCIECYNCNCFNALAKLVFNENLRKCKCTLFLYTCRYTYLYLKLQLHIHTASVYRPYCVPKMSFGRENNSAYNQINIISLSPCSDHEFIISLIYPYQSIREFHKWY